MHIHILNGPNLNLLGTREPEIYGHETLEQIEAKCRDLAEELGVMLSFMQSNHEGELVDHIQRAKDGQGIIINAAAYTHTSVALYDALKMMSIPVIEVHMSNIFKREEFRQHSFISPVADGVICGLGSEGYLLAIRALIRS